VSATSFVLDVPSLARDVVALPVRTPLVRPGDDLPELLRRCLNGMLRPDDVVCVSETAVAIAQGRSIRAETIRPSRLARLLAQRAGSYATVNQPESMQLVLESAGTLRVLAQLDQAAAPGDRVTVRLAWPGVHLFDATSGEAVSIELGAPSHHG
jgi:F420-0:gamma-glutamyl ligase